MATVTQTVFPHASKTDEKNPEATVTRQMDELFRLSEEERDRQLGPEWFSNLHQFYTLTGIASASAPTFRPKVVIPELQTMMLAEATDISESTPKVFLMLNDNRDKAREKAYQEHWRHQQYNLEIFLGELWALYCGTGFLQLGLDTLARRGKGEVWLQARDAGATFPDPGPLDPRHWAYVGIEDKMYLDDIMVMWPETGTRLANRNKNSARIRMGTDNNGPGGLSLPEGPMRYGSGYIPQKRVLGDGRLVVRQLFINDHSTEEVPESERKRVQEMLGPLVPAPRYRLQFPNGRWIVECNGVILADGNNWCPLRRFPIIPIQSMPRIKSFWVPPPIRYSKSLQDLAERMYTGLFENMVRLNNGIWFIDERTGIDANDFGALPGEVRVINAGSTPPEVRWPQPMPAHMMQGPDLLLQKQRLLQGFTPARGGQQAQGNISQDLFDATVFQSQVLTRMRAKLMAPSMQCLAETVFYNMMRYYRDASFPGFANGEIDMAKWTPAPGNWESVYDVYVDPSSIKPLSASYLRSLVSILMDKGKVPASYALKLLDVPNAEEIAEEQRQEMELAALTKLKRPR